MKTLSIKSSNHTIIYGLCLILFFAFFIACGQQRPLNKPSASEEISEIKPAEQGLTKTETPDIEKTEDALAQILSQENTGNINRSKYKCPCRFRPVVGAIKYTGFVEVLLDTRLTDSQKSIRLNQACKVASSNEEEGFIDASIRECEIID